MVKTEDGCEALRNQFFTDKVLEPARALSPLRNAILRQSPIREDQVASALFVNNILLRESAPRAQKHQIGTTNIGSIIRKNYAKVNAVIGQSLIVFHGFAQTPSLEDHSNNQSIIGNFEGGACKQSNHIGPRIKSLAAVFKRSGPEGRASEILMVKA